jgi:hypothetical protein
MPAPRPPQWPRWSSPSAREAVLSGWTFPGFGQADIDLSGPLPGAAVYGSTGTSRSGAIRIGKPASWVLVAMVIAAFSLGRRDDHRARLAAAVDTCWHCRARHPAGEGDRHHERHRCLGQHSSGHPGFSPGREGRAWARPASPPGDKRLRTAPAAIRCLAQPSPDPSDESFRGRDRDWLFLASQVGLSDEVRFGVLSELGQFGPRS